jgi:hypothetical protein
MNTDNRPKYTPGPWKFERPADLEESYRILKKELPDHEGYFRENDGTWSITDSTGLRVATASFKGKAKRGEAWRTADPEGMANARLISAVTDLAELLMESRDIVGDDWRERRDSVLKKAGLL